MPRTIGTLLLVLAANIFMSCRSTKTESENKSINQGEVDVELAINRSVDEFFDYLRGPLEVSVGERGLRYASLFAEGCQEIERNRFQLPLKLIKQGEKKTEINIGEETEVVKYGVRNILQITFPSQTFCAKFREKILDLPNTYGDSNLHKEFEVIGTLETIENSRFCKEEFFYFYGEDNKVYEIVNSTNKICDTQTSMKWENQVDTLRFVVSNGGAFSPAIVRPGPH